ncbi:hypothetical protein [Thiomonas sp.]
MRQTSSRSSKDLHQTVLTEIEHLLKQLDRNVTEPRIVQTMKQVNNLIAPIYDDLVKHIASLQQHARWDRFTIAFYGETNAGKSTIIETLRILLNEETKATARETFQAIQAEFGLTEVKLSALQRSLHDSSAQIDAVRAQTAERAAQIGAEKDKLKREMNRLHDAISAKKQVMSFWQELLSRIRKLPEERALVRGEQKRIELEAARVAEQAQIDVQIAQLLKANTELKLQQDKALAALSNLAPSADGDIIGTGRSDYTRDSHGYVFEANGQYFELLDVPGIEGKEAHVIDSILGAVKAAHAVFYVTGKAAAPQTSDEHRHGTLEKIRSHLGDQTEVWTIFNKRITNPVSLEKAGLLNQDERSSLAVLDQTMREHLGEQYQGHIALSAQPAFLAVADCLVPQSDLARSRAKFLAKASVEQLLSRSEFKEFSDWLRCNMVADCDARIRAANVKKLRVAVEVSAGKITLIQRDTVAPLSEDLKRDWAHVDQQIKLAVSELSPSLQTQFDGAVRVFAGNVRSHVYSRIDDGIENDDLKNVLASRIQAEQKSLEAQIPKQVTKQFERFQKDVTRVLNRFEERAEKLLDVFRDIGVPTVSDSFELNMTFESGVNYKKLVAALGGGLLMWWNPVGWVGLAIGGFTVILAAWKALRGFFSSDYKKSQQRKTVDDNIERIVDRMRDTARQSLDGVIEKAEAQISEIATGLEQQVKHFANVNSALIQICANLTHLSNKIADAEV